MVSAIYNRRSVRKFLNTPISKDDIVDIIQSGIKAPSSKNRQPWKFIVVQGRAKEKALKVFREGMLREESEPMLPCSKEFLYSAKRTADIMEEAPVIIFIYNTLGKSLMEELTVEERVYEICNIQSIGAAALNMLLEATEKGIGSLWICDIYFAYPELRELLKGEGDLVACVALGYQDEFPKARPRKKIDDVVEWRE